MVWYVRVPIYCHPSAFVELLHLGTDLQVADLCRPLAVLCWPPVGCHSSGPPSSPAVRARVDHCIYQLQTAATQIFQKMPTIVTQVCMFHKMKRVLPTLTCGRLHNILCSVK